jgi:hypothetical protein
MLGDGISDDDSGGKQRTNPERRDTGPLMHSPPSSKYLKHPKRRTARYPSGSRNQYLAKYLYREFF